MTIKYACRCGRRISAEDKDDSGILTLDLAQWG
jgi:hypothetical protein